MIGSNDSLFASLWTTVILNHCDNTVGAGRLWVVPRNWGVTTLFWSCCRYPGNGVRARHLGSWGRARRHASVQRRPPGPLRLRPHRRRLARRRRLPVGRLLGQHRLRQRFFQVVRRRERTARQGSRLGAGTDELAQQQCRSKGQPVQHLRLSRFLCTDQQHYHHHIRPC